ncbi:MAG: hypothetical protein HY423_11780 [Candidatus Lambdaproteobacteria bacterium]|nr:hypothetical protein [Candidatus Lambdaproteobacteria bacterium]
MPITQERQTIQDLRGVGFSEEQALLLAAKLESAAQATSEDLKGFIDRRLGEMEARIDLRLAQIDAHMAEMEARFERSLRLHLATILSAFVAVTGLALAIIKLFPGPG